MFVLPSEAQQRSLLDHDRPGPVVMLNLLRFREIADYETSPQLAPATPISGTDAYTRYAKGTLPLLMNHDAELLFRGEASAFLIGPETERWDQVLLIRYPSLAVFLAFTTDPRYLAVAGHRTAALEDSRLLPMSQG